ncbi:hypothetical protein [Halorubrum persicum]|uniref:hypothetical protein n=1 Tax=Halorubrum persicum TaxID=1383844 RepID=UPI001181A147|nr:hypothetical protein [Halorubrum persicum]
MAYDVTKVRWYGAEHEWTIGRPKDANTTDFWHYAVLSATGPDRNYVLGATPIKKQTEIAQALRRLLRRVHTHADFDTGRIYFDSEMYREDIATTCREIGADFLIQAKDAIRLQLILSVILNSRVFWSNTALSHRLWAENAVCDGYLSANLTSTGV